MYINFKIEKPKKLLVTYCEHYKDTIEFNEFELASVGSRWGECRLKYMYKETDKNDRPIRNVNVEAMQHWIRRITELSVMSFTRPTYKGHFDINVFGDIYKVQGVWPRQLSFEKDCGWTIAIFELVVDWVQPPFE